MKNVNIQISRKQQVVVPNYNGIIEGKNNISGISTTSSSSEIDGTSKKYALGKILGTGSFGIVCEVTDIDNGQRYALKKVLQDPRYKNRELDIMKILDHPNIIKLIDYFYTTGDEEPIPPQPPTDDINCAGHIGRNIIHSNSNMKSKVSNKFLNVIMEYIPETLYRVSKSFIRSGNIMPINIVSIYIYQLFRAVGFLHSLGICHRDIKPQNLLVDTKNNTLKLCDFGSAKRLIPNELSVAYICSRFYRAPELMLGATEYTPNIDLWSIGCVFGELILGKPLFSGETSIDQLVKIIQVLGTPTKEQMIAMNPHYTEVRFPTLKAKDWKKILPDNTPSLAIDLLQRILRYEPNIRIKPYEAMAHPFFDHLRESYSQNPIIVQGIGDATPELFNFSKYELSIIPDYLIKKILPNNYNIELEK
ncbi:protein kinase domain-containing protein [Cryptosporidium andersoni]|uniref:Protein kinase domain-containing protein n=1 Tax=Cryptosporidium andersoni TaxID=117008 RepID=A0A1J4MIR8_9CRYT|nr:protein kinase domain-containing protein [Cryptosporidium andersoni]